ncbi:hypothetical protein B9Z55_013864 [Caenorhabditis nigoni]|uniref:Uncharacterized protein n=1 Tax=Caenorhabditis nigoni TaxID=1611254 RepID=A0A2G5U4F4_9PELO|nr:hypothetical protein B9Z55_013864 [Caenorhabditis nigoni]
MTKKECTLQGVDKKSGRFWVLPAEEKKKNTSCGTFWYEEGIYFSDMATDKFGNTAKSNQGSDRAKDGNLDFPIRMLQYFLTLSSYL